ncbi:MAG: hypothetical protein QJR06_02610 [Alicyclobacillaceae bacterium]|nr:hypothetical protein [Alicyclobacillaceae bacterium]
MAWIYCSRLFDNQFQAGCYAARLRENGWRDAAQLPDYVAVFRTPRGRFGVKFLPGRTWAPDRKSKGTPS